jgi:two-component system NarL family response regulator
MKDPIRILIVEDQYFFRLALRTTIESRPDMSIVAEADKGTDAVALCRQHAPDMAIVDLRLPGLSGFEVIAALHKEELVNGILSVRAGRRFVSKSVGALLAERMPGSELTDRETDVLRLLVRGSSNREIGAQLGIAENTVRIHMGRIFDKLGVSDRTQAALVAIQRGLVHVD